MKIKQKLSRTYNTSIIKDKIVLFLSIIYLHIRTNINDKTLSYLALEGIK